MKRFGLAALGMAVLIPGFAAAQSPVETRSQQQQQQPTATTGTQTSGTQTSGTQTTAGSQTSGTQTTSGTQSTSGTETSGTQTTSGSTSGTDQTTSSQSGSSMGGGGGWMDRMDSHWIASAFVGTNTGGEDSDGAGWDFGGQVGYLWKGAIGAEFLANFSPDFELDAARSLLLNNEQPWVNSYMFNVMAAAPLGSEGNFQPYVSAGLGAMTLRADTITSTSGGATNSLEPDDSRGGSNIGFGLMGYTHSVGLRADVRWFRGFDAENSSDNGNSNGSTTSSSGANAIGNAVLGDLRFWRANIGLAFKW